MQLLSPLCFSIIRNLFCILLLFTSARGLLAADSSDLFITAYQACLEGDKLEGEGHTQDALKKYWFAESLIKEIVRNNPSWQKAVVEHRQKQVRDGLRRLQPGVTFPDVIKTPPSEHQIGGPVLQILNARLEGSDAGSKKLQVTIKSLPKETIDVTQVKVQVYFYDEENGVVVPSKSQVTSSWTSSPVDWKNGEHELLEVRHLPESANPGIKFVGYLIAVYYKGDLQDCRADPPRLKKLFEPKYFIGSEE